MTLIRLHCEPLEDRCLPASYFVATTGDDADTGLSVEAPFRTIQHALDVATSPGDTVFVRDGAYFEKLKFRASGDAVGGPITLRGYESERPILDGTGVAGQDMIRIGNKSHVAVIGFEIRNNFGVTDGSGVRVLGAGTGIEIRDNVIHDLRGKNAMGITVYGTSTRAAISGLVIDGNEIYDAEPAPSEALTVNGNVKNFTISDNRVHDVNNIGIDAIGGETDINPNPNLVARRGAIRGNTVHHARSSYGGGFAAGIYVDGGRNIVVENNVSYENDLGIEIGAENPGVVTSGVVVRNNLVYRNDKAGIVFGGYASGRGRVRNSSFVNNTLYQNDTLGEGYGQLWIQYASDNVIANNIFWASANKVLLSSEAGNVRNKLDYNLWYSESGADDVTLAWNGRTSRTFSDHQARTGRDAHSLFADPLFADADAFDFRLTSTSPAIDVGTAKQGWFAPTDIAGRERPAGVRPDVGAYEVS